MTDRNDWKEAILEQLVVTCIDAPLDESPESILRRIIDMHIAIERDPAVQASKWQSVGDNIPAPGITVQALTDTSVGDYWHKRGRPRYRVIVAECYGRDEEGFSMWREIGSWHHNVLITHWQPLAEAPAITEEYDDWN